MSLWIALYLPELPLECFAPGQALEGAQLVSEPLGGRQQVARCNLAAQALGVRSGMSLAAALALSGDLLVRRREREREQQVLADLASWAWQFSSQISLDPCLLLIEIGASRRLFGGLDALRSGIVDGLEQLGHRCQWAIAPTPAAAALLARSLPGVQVEQTDALPPLLDAVPLDRLTRDPASRALIRRIGLSSVGDCLRLPRAGLSRRLGPELALQLERLLGHAPDPRPPWRPPARFFQRLELPAEIGQCSALAFPARRLLIALCGFLRGHGGAAVQLRWRLLHADCLPTDFLQGLLGPNRDPEHLIELFRERIERLTLPAPVRGIELRVDDWQPFAERSETLFDDGPQSAGLCDLLERLGARLGPGRVCGLRQVADHRPERSSRWTRPGQGGGLAGEAVADQALPLWLLEPPKALRLREGQPYHAGPLRLLGRARRIESGWWDGVDVSRDYWQALSANGERLWLYRDRRSGQWYLHGLFD